MEIQQLRHLLAAAESSNYAKAAKSCFTSRQNIAHSIKSLESEFGIILFERKGNDMQLTSAGRQMVCQATEIILRVDTMSTMFADNDRSDKPLRLAVSTNLFAGIPDKTSRFFKEHSGRLRFSEMACSGCYESVCSGKSDAALVMCMGRRFSDCGCVETICEESYAIVDESSQLASLTGLSITDLKDTRLLLMSAPDFQYVPLFAKLDTCGYDRANVSVITSTSSMLHMMKQHNGVGIVSKKFAINPPAGSQAIPFLDEDLHWHFHVLFQKNTHRNQAVMKLVRDIQMTFAEDCES